ncbi:MAG TPA: hypothetical protein VFE47_14815, partial [Tepidisphaeraceae bacterium]|nr:hypothetical protein [Tepidisphaeraceae bacterium]
MKTCETTLRLPRRILLLALLLVLAILAPYPAALVRGEDPTPTKDAGQPKAKAGEERAAGNLLDTVTDVDLKKFGWTRHGGAVVSDGHDVTSLMLPYLPPDEYDLTAEFSRLTNDNDILITFPVGAGTCAFSVGAHNNKHAVLGKIARHWDDGNPTLTDASVANNEKHQMEVKVRRDVVEGYLDGKRLCRWLTNGDDLMSHPFFMPHNPGLIALTGWQGAVAFYSVKVTAVHGQGIAASERDADGLVYNPRILRPGEDGSIQLAARDATVHGKAMNYDGASGQECLEYREPTGQYLSWFVEAPKEGDYGVDVTYACSDGKDGSDVEVGLEPIKAAGAAPSAKLVLHVKDSGGWEQLQSESLGKLHLPAGRQMLTVRVKSRPHDAVMNLRRIVLLAPIPAPAVAGTTQPGDKSSTALYLLTKKNPENLHTPTSLLEREIYRQALLIAARDGVGVQTRDESLREWHGDAPAGATLNLDASGLHLEIFAGKGAAIWRGNKPRAAADQTVLNWNIAGIEPLARGEFVKLLQTRGFSGKPNVMKPGAPAPADAEARLGELEELSQFNLLRDTHALIHDDGESEARLGVLVRAYANLGQLTRYHWSVEHQVFAARSLLYAQRMVANDPKSAVALWHRAYAMAMAGAQGQAMKDLAAAAQLGDEAKAPPWVRLLQPFCNYDFTKLTDLAAADKSQSPLAMYLAFVTVEQSGSTAVTLKVEKAALDANTRCLRVIDAMCNETGPGLLNQLVDIGPGIFSSTLGTELEKTPGLPKAMIDPIRDLRRADGNPAGRETICQALIAQGAPDKDRREPSLAALGRLIQETTFTHVRRKAHLIAMQWGVDASDYVADVRPLVSEHRFKGVIDAYGKLHEQTRDNAIKAMGTVRWEDLTVTELPLYRVEQWAQSRGEGTPNDLLGPIFFDMDAGSFDKEAWIAFFG